MVRDSKGELRPPNDPQDFLSIAPELSEIATIDFVPLMNKDSTNVNHRDWATFSEAIHKRLHDGYDGFVVAHGTDTMHFSASAVGFALGHGLPCPVVFTGAQTIPEVRHGDARVNLIRACKVALEDIGEVVISFGDYIFRGCRAQKKDEASFDAFESPAQFPLGFIRENIVLSPLVQGRVRLVARPVQSSFADGVLQISLIPGLQADLIQPSVESDACKGLILQSFGAGNVPNFGEYSFIDLISKCQVSGKPVIVTSQFPANSTLHSSYAPGRRAVEAGAIPTSNMTSSCAVAKFRWAIAQASGTPDPSEVVRKIMGTVFIEEMD